jgi:glutathione synthase/RimK-type ligase-like ATP-grasp enzyme
MNVTVAFATCTRLGHSPDTDSRVLEPSLRRRGLKPVFLPWDSSTPLPRETAACVVKAVWDYHERPVQFLRWVDGVAARVPIWNSPDLLRRNFHKSYLLQLDRAGVPTVPTVLARVGTGDQALHTKEGWTDVVIKPAVSVGALRTQRFRDTGPDAASFLRELTRDTDALVQPFVPSILEEGETSIVYIEGRFSHAVHKQVADGEFAAQRDRGARISLCEPNAAQFRVAEAALRTAAGTLFARVDLVNGDGTPRVMELELIEPALFLDLWPDGAERLAHAIALRLGLRGRTENGTE